jgi:hypothetical protein
LPSVNGQARRTTAGGEPADDVPVDPRHGRRSRQRVTPHRVSLFSHALTNLAEVSIVSRRTSASPVE